MKFRSKTHKITMLLLSGCCLLMAPGSGAQTNIGGIVNSYYAVSSINTAQSSLGMNSTTGLSLYDYVMVVEMKGATVNTSNSASFGSLSAYNDAGNYEINVICGLSATRVYLLNKFSKTYDPVNGFVQLVKIPSYANANVTAPLYAKPWDKASGTGGVLAVKVNGTLTMQADANATDAGFKGGAFKLLNGACSNFFFYTDYFYDTTGITNGGAAKGEGIAELTATYSGGRGASANGGGGGNDHNTGGAGGGNLYAGGKGGNNSSTVGCQGSYPGIGTYPLSNAGNRIFLGGGGGTGHANNGGTLGGGNGGGIVFIKAVVLVGNGYKISANGSNGASSVGDGASGGGAGGTIIMDVLTYTGPLTVEANGGNGGDENNLNIAGRCYGTGGGGSAGVIYYTGAIPVTATNITSAGAAGLSTNGNPVSCNGATGATAGINGSVAANYPLTVSNVPETYCNLLLSSKYLALSVTTSHPDYVSLKWNLQVVDNASYFLIEKSTDGFSWKQTGRVLITQGLTHYQFRDASVNTGAVCYRVKAVLPSGISYYSNIVCANAAGGIKWLLVNNPVKDILYINGLPPESTSILLYDATGKLIKQYSAIAFSQPLQLSVAGLSGGVYYIRCNGIVKAFLKL